MAVAIIMGSSSDYDKLKPTIETLAQFHIKPVVRVLSAHRSPEETLAYARSAHEEGIKVIIAAAGKAAHLPGVIASVTNLPVIGLPISTSVMGGIDSLLSIVQMPSGVPVMTVAIDGGVNAALSAIRILALSDENMNRTLNDYVAGIYSAVQEQDRLIQEKVEHDTRR